MCIARGPEVFIHTNYYSSTTVDFSLLNSSSRGFHVTMLQIVKTMGNRIGWQTSVCLDHKSQADYAVHQVPGPSPITHHTRYPVYSNTAVQHAPFLGKPSTGSRCLWCRYVCMFCICLWILYAVCIRICVYVISPIPSSRCKQLLTPKALRNIRIRNLLNQSPDSLEDARVDMCY